MAERSQRSSRIAPGLIRKPVSGMPPVTGSPDGIPLTLTRQGPPESWPVGLLAPGGRTPWGCLFFALLAAVILISLMSGRIATLAGLVGLIVFWSAFNHPRRTSADAVRRTLRLVGARSGKRAMQALAPAIKHMPGDDGLHYLAAMVSLLTGRSSRALEHLAEARPRFQEFAEYHHLLARASRDMDRADAAAESYRRALEYPAYPSRNLLQLEARDHFEAQGDHGALRELALQAREDLNLNSPAVDQAFRSGLGRFDQDHDT
jgi:hypothetical protein